MKNMTEQKLITAAVAAGWDTNAIKAWKKIIKKEACKRSTADLLLQLEQIGSDSYTRLFTKSRLLPMEKLELVLKQMQAQIDQNGFLQLAGDYRLSPSMPPHGRFLKLFRKAVRQTFLPQGLRPVYQSKRKKELAIKIHLFRSYLDRHNLWYVRQYFPGNTDWEKLQNYQRQAKIKFDYSTDARLHNRYLSNQDFTYPQNMKIQVTKWRRMSEFIVNLETGKFVSEWDFYQQQANGNINAVLADYQVSAGAAVANAGSFNYGLPKGKYAWLLRFSHSHQLLDVKHPTDPQLRYQFNHAKASHYYWKSPQTYLKDSKGGYADIVKKGPVDFLAWQQVPLDQKKEIYQAFVVSCRKRLPKKNPGFAFFWQHYQTIY
ncbi:MAG: DUF3114 domain-containing protein [Liquorilactobacillus nagelii]|jgi:hypothetical protein|uniref:DUF3114 domain-containing protein n=1 Tax=Liquorilactobacillus nagelii TaxID=82688 RepID=UPI0024328F00|nr:DUF3114 domain-containing protein [Liquorilactobacillus nagelii]MCI1633674.1 DUF3114 domain-containing protein [Liquorilactobacillus nagelii]MCI1921557.1 DUF3114 domain-containing protein [Liquorilactobacillus nagelii]MCI1977047.1 DUF3114 domain-containing protein [Liquorilactobacillus nagelii]